jgi:hypothetical protein
VAWVTSPDDRFDSVARGGGDQGGGVRVALVRITTTAESVVHYLGALGGVSRIE